MAGTMCLAKPPAVVAVAAIAAVVAASGPRSNRFCAGTHGAGLCMSKGHAGYDGHNGHRNAFMAFIPSSAEQQQH